MHLTPILVWPVAVRRKNYIRLYYYNFMKHLNLFVIKPLQLRWYVSRQTKAVLMEYLFAALPAILLDPISDFIGVLFTCVSRPGQSASSFMGTFAYVSVRHQHGFLTFTENVNDPCSLCPACEVLTLCFFPHVNSP